MELSRISVTPSYDGASELYYTGGEPSEGVLFVRAGTSVDFCTYFSALDAQLLLERTSVRSVELGLFYDGLAEVEVHKFLPASEKSKKGKLKYTTYVMARELAENGYKRELSIAGGGIISFKLYAKQDTYFYGGTWSCDDKYINRQVRLGVVMCTYKREKFALDNARRLSELIGELPDLSVYIVDNGGTLKREDMPPRVNLLPSKNLGGSGGFSRGMIECIRRGDTHYLLMDDDITIEVDSVRRVYAIYSILREEYADYGIGGAMMSTDKPCSCYENGARCGRVRLKLLKHDVDLTDVGGLLWCRAENNAKYSAWWFSSGTVDMLLKSGLSMPFFIKYDDVEFGYRTVKEYPKIYTIGIGVWHQSFEKKVTLPLNYYLLRNFMITKAVTGQRKISAFWRAMFACVRALTKKKKFAYVRKAIGDYLKGPQFLLTADGEQLNEELFARLPKTNTFIGRAFITLGLFFKMWFTGRSVAKKYRKVRDKLTSVNAWCDRLELKEEDYTL